MPEGFYSLYTAPYTTIGYQFWIAPNFYSFKAIRLKVCILERLIYIFDGQESFLPKKSPVTEFGVYTIVHYGVTVM